MESISGFFDELTPGKAVVAISGVLVMGIIWLLNIVFTFSYGYDVVGPFLLLDQLGDNGSAILSGIVAVLFFDISYTVGFATLLFGCSSNWQYAVTSLQFATTFILSILASTVSIVMLSPLGDYVPPLLVEAIRYLGYGALIVGFVVNAVATIGYIVTMPQMAEQIRQTVKAAAELQTTIRRQTKLERQSRKMADEQISAYIPFVAEIKADEGLLNYLKAQGYDRPDDVMRTIKRMRGKREIQSLMDEPDTRIIAADGSTPPQLNPVNAGENILPVPPPQRTRVASEGQPPANFQRRASGPEKDQVLSLMVELMGEETTKRVLDQIMPE